MKASPIVKKSVRFSDTVETVEPTHYFDNDSIPDFRSSVKRHVVETMVMECGKEEHNLVKTMIESFEKHDVSIVFGNLGRQPHLLNYFLDLYFNHEQVVQVTCRWQLPICYQKNNADNSDFLFQVEPFFGETILKPKSTKHLIVLTSHLNLTYPKEAAMLELHLSSRKEQHLPDPHLRNYDAFTPPVFHDYSNHIVPKAVLLDVSKAKSAHEAYLRLLTGREMIDRKPFKIRMNPDDLEKLKIFLKVSRRRARRHFYEPWMENVYWNGFY